MSERLDVLVVGAGPAGIAAAVTAAESGARVAVVDESPRVGGQVWHGEIPDRAKPWMRRLEKSGVTVHGSTSILDASASRLTTTAGTFECARLVLACGARELLLPFPGWTLPGVTGAGGLQALVHDGLDVAGQRIVVGGTGPLLLQVAKVLRTRGAKVVRVAEQASAGALLAFAAGLPADKKREALGLWCPGLRVSSWIESAHGEDAVSEVIVRTPLGRERIRCDRLAVGYSLVANTELASRLGCEVRNGAVVVDDAQRTTVDGVFAAGEVCGVKGAGGAIHDGICAGLTASGQAPGPRPLRDRERAFGARLERAFALRPEILSLAEDDTLVCRCEDVAARALRDREDWNSAKLHTRCGMGPCQGRVCGSATRKLFGWGPSRPRPPLVPVPIGALMNERIEP